MIEHDEYFSYLRKRSLTGMLYRRCWLYPRICSYLHGKVLDIGCGLGDMLKHRKNTVGVDINQKTVEWCRSLNLEAYVMRPDILPFSGTTFQGVILDNVLEHILEPEALLSEIQRVLISGGRLVIGVPGTLGYARDQDHKIFYDLNSMNTLLFRCGFSKYAHFYMPIPWAWLDVHLSQYCLYGVYEKL